MRRTHRVEFTLTADELAALDAAVYVPNAPADLERVGAAEGALQEFRLVGVPVRFLGDDRLVAVG